MANENMAALELAGVESLRRTLYCGLGMARGQGWDRHYPDSEVPELKSGCGQS